MPIIVDIALATLCIIGNAEEPTTERCYPVLVGNDTPRGEFKLQQRLVESPGYGGDVLEFKEQELYIYAIHRVWTGRPWERREQRLKSSDVKMRRITMGCINVDPAVYDELVDCCSSDTLTIK